MTQNEFLDSVIVEELDTIPLELMRELEAQSEFGALLKAEEDDFWGTTDIAPL